MNFQACFGTTGLAQVGFSSGFAQFTSYCPGGSLASDWDSPSGTPNAGEPILNSSHGTHVAGIAAGGLKTTPAPTYRGMASAANIAAVQIFSQRQGDSGPSLVNADLLSALNLAVTALPSLPAGQQQPYTLNMSISAEFHAAACTTGNYAAYANAVLLLTNAGIPVVASTGNDGYDNAVGFPACLPQIIKVTASVNDGLGNSRGWFNGSQGGNVANPSAFGGTHWIAPGGGKPVKFGPINTFTRINSSINNSDYGNENGTSMAAPHITGAYAVAKGVNPAAPVADFTAWFITRSIAVPITTTNPPGNFSIRRIYITLP